MVARVNKYRRPSLPVTLVLYGMFLAAAGTILYPLAWMVYSAFKPNEAIFSSVFALPQSFYIHNFVDVFTNGHLGLYFRNSLFVAGVSTAGVLAVSSLTAYALTAVSFRGRQALLIFFIIGLMVPAQALIISAYTWISMLGLIDTYWALILMYVSSVSFGVLVLRDYFASIPIEIREAARMDGASHWKMFTQIVLPLSRPSLATVGLLYFIAFWNDFLYPLLFLQTATKYTVPLGVLLLSNRYNIEWGDQMAALTVATVVPIVVYVIFQKQFVRALTAGSIKG
jgi:raffinose/stachyose/melibiose transport system permease protein